MVLACHLSRSRVLPLEVHAACQAAKNLRHQGLKHQHLRHLEHLQHDELIDLAVTLLQLTRWKVERMTRG